MITHAPHLPAHLPATEELDLACEELDSWPPATQLRVLWQGQLAAVAAIGPALPVMAEAVTAAASLLRTHANGRLVYAGAGTSARLAAGDGAELNPTFDWPDGRMLLLPAGGPEALLRAVENAEDDLHDATDAVARHRIGPADVVIGVAASGATPFTCAVVQAARAAGALTIGISNSPGAPLLALAEYGILAETAPEPVAGSTRMKAGTAQKVILTLLSTGIMAGLGRVHRGRMVDMRARNAKLRSRAVRMVADLASVTPEAAEDALLRTDLRLKEAILVAGGAEPTAAAAALARAGGNLRGALAELAPAP